jgi:hypothetical protein
MLACTKPTVAPKAPTVAALSAAAPASPPPLALVPADVARTTLVATFVAPALEHTLQSGVELVRRAAPLPVDAAGVRDMLLAQVGLPPEVARHLDLKAPIAGAAVAGGAGRSPLTAFTFAGTSVSDVAALIAALGRVVERRGAATQVETKSGDRAWFLAMGTVIVFADTEEALVRAGTLAIEARRASRDDLSIMVYPDALARAVGTDVKSAMQHFLGDLEERAAAGGSPLGPEGARQVRELVAYLEDVSVAEIAVGLDAERGAAFSVRLHPRPGTKLETVSRFVKTIAVDGLLLGSATATATAKTSAKGGGKGSAGAPVTDADFVITSAYGEPTLDQLRRHRTRLPANGGKAEVAAGRWLDAMTDGLTGELSMLGRLQPTLSGEVVYPTVDAAHGATIQTALAGIDKAALTAAARAATQGEGVELKIIKARQESVGKLRALHATLAFQVRGGAKGVVTKLVGPAGLDAYFAVVDSGRLVVTIGSGAKARLAAMSSGGRSSAPAPAPTPALASALAGAGSRSLFAFVDVRRVLSFALAVSGDPRLRMLAGAAALPMPVLGGAAGDGRGSVFTLDLTLPPACFAGMGSLVQSAMMLRN